MATPSPVTEPIQPSPEKPTQLPDLSSSPSVPALNSELPAKDSKETSTPVGLRPLGSSSNGADVVTVPSYSRWFSWSNIHESERRFLSEFFDGRSPSKTPRVYKYCRDAIIRKFRENPSRKITFTEVRRTLVGDVGSIRRVFDFLEGWGLINYAGTTTSKPQSKWEERENKSGGLNGDFGGSPFGSSILKRETVKKICSGCKSVCSIACFVCDKFDLTLCARCYVRSNYQVAANSEEFRRVEVSEETKTEWTEKETLHLLEAVMHYGDDWKKVAEHVGGRSEKECVTRFIKLPFGEQFVEPLDSGELDNYHETNDQTDSEIGARSVDMASPTKRRRLNPLADASNPIMAQAAFLSAVVGSEVAEAAAEAAVAALSDVELNKNQRSRKESIQQESTPPVSIDNNIGDELEGAVFKAQAQLEKEEYDLEKSISGIIEVQMKEIQDKIVHFEEVELQMEKEWQQLRHMKNLLFADQLTLLRQKTTPLKIGESIEKENVKPTYAVT